MNNLLFEDHDYSLDAANHGFTDAAEFAKYRVSIKRQLRSKGVEYDAAATTDELLRLLQEINND